jgi:phytanoyl-CoA hydroxylase
VNQTHSSVLSDREARDFQRDGFLVVRQLAAPALCRALVDEVDGCLNPPLGPLELEAELGYPGAPDGLHASGGRTPRRLLNAYSRGPMFRDWARAPAITQRIAAFMGGGGIALVQAHHNCIMTKYPRFSSETGWHQDIRYWRFAAPDLINAWLALGPEGRSQGGLRVVPGSHQMHFAPQQFDEEQFFRPDVTQNRQVLEQAVDVELECGDVLFFHCRLLHAAGRNTSMAVKRSLVFTYNPIDNAPLAGSRSDRLAQIPI